jgi:hypothetical protein
MGADQPGRVHESRTGDARVGHDACLPPEGKASLWVVGAGWVWFFWCSDTCYVIEACGGYTKKIKTQPGRGHKSQSSDTKVCQGVQKPGSWLWDLVLVCFCCSDTCFVKEVLHALSTRILNTQPFGRMHPGRATASPFGYDRKSRPPGFFHKGTSL